MIESSEKNLVNSNIFYRAENIVCDDDYVWYKTNYHNMLFCVDRKTGVVRTITLPDSYRDRLTAFRRIEKVGRRIYLLPFNAREICIYDLDSKKFDAVYLPHGVFDYSEKGGFMASAVIGDEIIMFGYHPVILFFNVKTREITFVRGFEKEIPEDKRPKVWFESNCIIDNRLYLSVNGTHRLIIIDPEKKVISHADYGVRNDDEPIDGLYYDGSLIWTVPRNGKEIISLYSWNPISNEFKKHELNTVKYQGLYSVTRIGIYNGRLFLIPARLNDGYIYQIERGGYEKINLLPTVKLEDAEKESSDFRINYLGSIITRDNHLITIHSWSMTIVDINMVDGEVTVLKMKIHKGDYVNYIAEEIQIKGLYLDITQTIEEGSEIFTGIDAFIAMMKIDRCNKSGRL